MNRPKLLVFSSRFPSTATPHEGVLIKERMLRVGKKLPTIIVSPIPWSPWQALTGLQVLPPLVEAQQDITVYFPRFLRLPQRLKNYQALFMAMCTMPLLFKLRQQFNIIDAHVAYPDGYAATLLGKWLKRPVTMTLYGTEPLLAQQIDCKNKMLTALNAATQIFSVCAATKQQLAFLGMHSDKIKVISHGVNLTMFQPVHRTVARTELNLHQSAKVLISVGGLVERKGVQRVLEVLPALVAKYPELVYLIVGGERDENNRREQLEQQVRELKLEANVRFLGEYPRDQLKIPLSAADLLVQATANEGWSSALLEAMACGLPVITTDVGGNAEIVSNPELGKIVPFGQSDKLLMALLNALKIDWDKQAIIDYAQQHDWETPIQTLVEEFQRITAL